MYIFVFLCMINMLFHASSYAVKHFVKLYICLYVISCISTDFEVFTMNAWVRLFIFKIIDKGK